MHVCMHVCTYVCMCVCACVCIYICIYIYVCMYVCIYVCVYMCVYVCMYACMYVCMCVCVWMYVGVYVCVCVCMYMYVCMYVCVCVCVRVYVCMYEIMSWANSTCMRATLPLHFILNYFITNIKFLRAHFAKIFIRFSSSFCRHYLLGSNIIQNPFRPNNGRSFHSLRDRLPWTNPMEQGAYWQAESRSLIQNYRHV